MNWIGGEDGAEHSRVRNSIASDFWMIRHAILLLYFRRCHASIMNDDYRILTSLDELEFEGLLDLYFHWDKLRGERSAPRHWEFDVLDLPKIVSSLSVIEVLDDGSDARIKFNGQSVVDHIGRDRTGKRLLPTELDPLRERVLEVFGLVVTSGKPVVSGPRIPLDTLNRATRTQVLALPLMNEDRVAEIVTMVASD